MQGMLCGILFGLVYDIYVGRFIGTDMLIYLFIGYFFSAVVATDFMVVLTFMFFLQWRQEPQ